MSPMAKAARRRHPVLVSLVAATALLAGVLAGNFINRTDGGTQVALPAPHVGDRWGYQAIFEGEWAFGVNDIARDGGPVPYASFEWLAPKQIRDAEGTAILVDQLKAILLEPLPEPGPDGRQWVARSHVYDFQQGSTEVLAHENARTGHVGGPGLLPFGVELPGTTAVRTMVGWEQTFEDPAPPCGARSPWQGAEVPPTVRWPLACGPLSVAEGTFRAGAAERIGDWRTQRFESANATVWLSSGVPVPVQVRMQDPARSVTLTLVWENSGTQALGGTEAVVSAEGSNETNPAEPRSSRARSDDGNEPARALEWAPRLRWGIDDTGVDHPFPASRAFQQALTDPLWPELRDWLREHPDASTFYVEYRPNNNGDRPGWTFGLADGDSLFAFSTLLDPGSFLYVASAPDQVTHERMDWLLPLLEPLAPPAHAFPGLLPTAESALDRWRAYNKTDGGRGQQADGWGLLIACESMPCEKAETLVVAGNRPVTFLSVAAEHPFASLGLYYTQDGSQIEVRDGRTTAYVRWDESASYGPVLLAPGGPSAASGQAIGTGWQAPTPFQGGAIGIAALLVGLAYKLWPTLKASAPFGLFSRISGQDLLDHPARAQLLMIVQAEPGIHFQDLVRRSSLPNGTAIHHLGKLTKSGLVSVRALGRYSCYFPGASPSRSAMASAAVLRSDGARRVYEAIQGRPGLSGLELAGLVGLQPSTVNYHVQKLVESGLVLSAREGRSVRLSAVAAS
jgi:DNA-binding transcriptional ArsR family regulator